MISHFLKILILCFVLSCTPEKEKKEIKPLQNKKVKLAKLKKIENKKTNEKIDDERTQRYKKVFPDLKGYYTSEIEDPISDEPINTELLIVKDGQNKKLGYIREISTTTGCNSACLPVIFTLYLDKNGEFLTLKSKPGLTKKGHAPFTRKDYLKLEMIILKNPDAFKNIKHPLEMVDGITGATINSLKEEVVPRAAFTSLRVNLYFQQTLTEIKKLSSKNK